MLKEMVIVIEIKMIKINKEGRGRWGGRVAATRTHTLPQPELSLPAMMRIDEDDNGDIDAEHTMLESPTGNNNPFGTICKSCERNTAA